jgi:hypothetical protein
MRKKYEIKVRDTTANASCKCCHVRRKKAKRVISKDPKFQPKFKTPPEKLRPELGIISAIKIKNEDQTA